jgi:hypothetical protein
MKTSASEKSTGGVVILLLFEITFVSLPFVPQIRYSEFDGNRKSTTLHKRDRIENTAANTTLRTNHTSTRHRTTRATYYTRKRWSMDIHFLFPCEGLSLYKGAGRRLTHMFPQIGKTRRCLHLELIRHPGQFLRALRFRHINTQLLKENLPSIVFVDFFEHGP